MKSQIPGSAAWLSLRALDRALVGFLQSQSPCNDPRHIWLAALTSYQLGRGHACLDVRALTEQPASLLGWTAEQVRALPTDWLEALDHWTWAQGEGSPVVLAGPPRAPRVYLRRAHAAEQLIRSCIAQRLQQTFSVTGLQQYLQGLFGPADTQALDWQRVACALATRSALTLITGGPGTGKTTTVARLLALLSASGCTHCQSCQSLGCVYSSGHGAFNRIHGLGWPARTANPAQFVEFHPRCAFA